MTGSFTMPARGDRFRLKRIRLTELNESIEMMEERKKLETPPIISILDKNIDYCRIKRNAILQEMIEDGFKGKGL